MNLVNNIVFYVIITISQPQRKFIMTNYIFSEQHSWQGNDAVQQILVLKDQESKDFFDVEFAKRVHDVGIENASDSHIGASLKLRAVKDVNGKWIPIIRCGVHGTLIQEFHTWFDTAEETLEYLLEVFDKI